MTWFADRPGLRAWGIPHLVFLALLPSATVALADEPPASLVDAVHERLASEWHVDADRLVIEWGSFLPPGDALEASQVRFVGRGDDGRLLVVATFPDDGGSTSVRIRAGIRDTAWVAARALRSGTVLTLEDRRSDPRVAWGPPAGEREDVVEPGWVVHRAMAAGDRLVAPSVRPPMLIEAGQPVCISWSRGHVLVELFGTALNAARRGEIVRARLVGRTEPVAGIVVAAGLADMKEEITR